MSKADAGPAKRPEELRKEISDALTSPDGFWFTNMVSNRPATAVVDRALPGVEIHDEFRQFTSNAEPASSPKGFLQKLINVLEETAASTHSY